MLLGIAIAASALVAGIAVTGVSVNYFFQPTGILIVLGGTFWYHPDYDSAFCAAPHVAADS